MTDNRLRELERAWHTSGSPGNERAYLNEKLRVGHAQYVFLDPDGTFNPWVGVLVRRSTGVIYATQRGGTATDERMAEGFFIPLGGFSFDSGTGPFDLSTLSAPFHWGSGCDNSATGATLPEDRLKRVRSAVADLPCWRTERGDGDKRLALQLIEDRLPEAVEAWIPVETPYGPGVLVYKTCD